mmetsp:Transcript_10148/g.20380  ORF Transcript_10148/g.20380 Transcript_10148/m.20380 type:complete len:267 (-) Transcript_10148:272-1072(-)
MSAHVPSHIINEKNWSEKTFLLFRNISKCIYCVDPVVSHHLFSPRQTGLRSAHHQQARGRQPGVSPPFPCARTARRRDVLAPRQTAAGPGFRADVSRRTFPCGGRCSPLASTGCSAPLSPAGCPDAVTSRSCAAHRCCTSSLRGAAGRPSPGTRTVSPRRARHQIGPPELRCAQQRLPTVGRGHLAHRVGPWIGRQAELLRPRHVGGGRPPPRCAHRICSWLSVRCIFAEVLSRTGREGVVVQCLGAPGEGDGDRTAGRGTCPRPG